MCGIVGLHGAAPDRDGLESLLAAMNGRQFHRGPDGEGTYVDDRGDLGVAMRRLAIIDLAGGSQPMHSEDGRFVLVFNGEIVNAPDLRVDLAAQGERFVSDHSDTEVLLKLLCREGVSALGKLNGMFAFALYDTRERVLTLGRDRLGIKPLYYTLQGGRFAFASELKSLLALPFVARTVNTQSLFHYLSLMYVPGPESIVAGVSRLEPGHVLTYRLRERSFSISRWWTLSFAPAAGRASRDEWQERVRHTLARAVERWTLSDVPLACSLSGGLDSSSIVGLLAQRGQRVATYSLGFEGGGESEWNELPLAADVARRWDTSHHEIVLDPRTLLDDLPRMVWHMDEPYGGGLPSWAVFDHMSRDVKVGLTGTGGDELFGNYGKWTGLESRWLLQPRQNPDNFRRLFFDRYYYFPDAEKRAVFRARGDFEDTSALLFRRYAEAGSRTVRDRCAVTDMTTQLPDEFLAMTDRFSMAHSLEVRPPFLDNDLVELVSGIPADLRTRRGDLKGLLREAVAPVLPPSLLAAPKKGFVIPLRLWLRRELRPLAERLLAPARLEAQGLFAPDLFERHVAPHMQGRRDLTTRVWGLLMFQLWHVQFIENGAATAPERVRDYFDCVR